VGRSPWYSRISQYIVHYGIEGMISIYSVLSEATVSVSDSMHVRRNTDKICCVEYCCFTVMYQLVQTYSSCACLDLCGKTFIAL